MTMGGSSPSSFYASPAEALRARAEEFSAVVCVVAYVARARVAELVAWLRRR